MMRWLANGFLLSAMLGATPPVTAAVQGDAVKALVSTSYDRNALYTEEGRLALVLAARNYCEALDAVIPRNRPSENEWLDKEVTAGGDRAMAAISSKEFGRRRMLEFTENCRVIARGYIAGQNQQLNLFNMIYFWARFAPDAEQWAATSGVPTTGWGFSFLHSVIEALAMSGALASSDGIVLPKENQKPLE
jgi:hypothetical protein